MKSNRYARHSDNTLRVQSSQETEHHVTYESLLRQRRSIVAQREREAARFEAELAEVDDMIEACQALGVTAMGSVLPLEVRPEPADGPLPQASAGRKMWAFLTRPRGLGQ